MAYRLPGERYTLDLDGPTVEVERLVAPAIRLAVIERLGAALKSQEPPALLALYGMFVDEAQPTWDILDHRGPIPATASGLLRLRPELGIGIVTAWLDKPPDGSAVDTLVEPGPLRDQLKAELRRKRKVGPDGE